MKHKTPSFKKGLLFALMMAAVLILSFGAVHEVKAASAAEKKAHKLLEKKRKTIVKSHMDTYYKYFDINGDGVKELLTECYPAGENGGSARVYRIHQVKKGKVKRILSTYDYGVSRFTFYKKSKSLIIYWAGHGGEGYSYFKLKKGIYKKIAGKARQAIAGGNFENGPWSYYGASKSVSKASFTKKIKGIKKGKARVSKIESWKYYRNPDWTW